MRIKRNKILEIPKDDMIRETEKIITNQKRNIDILKKENENRLCKMISLNRKNFDLQQIAENYKFIYAYYSMNTVLVIMILLSIIASINFPEIVTIMNVPILGLISHICIKKQNVTNAKTDNKLLLKQNQSDFTSYNTDKEKYKSIPKIIEKVDTLYNEIANFYMAMNYSISAMETLTEQKKLI